MRDVNRIATQIITPNTGTILDRATIKNYLRLDTIADDDLLDLFISQVINLAQHNTRRFLLNTTVKATLDQFPAGSDYYQYAENVPIAHELHDSSVIYLPYLPIQSLTSIVTYDRNDTSSTFDSSFYRLDQANDRIVINDGSVLPTDLRDRQAVEITYVCGYGATAASIPAGLLAVMYGMVMSLYTCRGQQPDMMGLMSWVAFDGAVYDQLR